MNTWLGLVLAATASDKARADEDSRLNRIVIIVLCCLGLTVGGGIVYSLLGGQ